MTLHNPTTARHHYARGLWRDETLYMVMARHAAERPDAFAVRDRRYRLTWSELKAWVDVVSGSLHDTGLAVGDRVAVWLPSRVETLVTFLACSRNGYACILSLHQNHTVNEVLTLLERCGAKGFVGQPRYGADAAGNEIFERLAATGRVRAMLALAPHDAAPQDQSHDAEGASLPGGSAGFPQPDAGTSAPPVETDPDKVVYIAFTSGTTGQPKALMHSDNTLLANGRAMVADWGHGPHAIFYCLGPLSHHLAMIGIEQSLVAGCEYVTSDLPKGVSPLDRLVETGATYVLGVPTHAIDIQQEAAARGFERLGAAEVFYMSGAPIAPEVARRFLDYGVIPQNTYGMTEGGTQTSTLRTDSFETMVGTVGQCCGRGNPCYELQVFKAEDRDSLAAPGEVGELGGRGAALMLGYFANQEATEKTFNRHGWLMSGDLARTDADGNIIIVGRAKDIIIRGGHNIYPVEIESLALRHPDVAQAAAFPMPDARLGEKVCLAIIPVAGRAVAGAQMLDHLAAVGLSKYDMPEYFMQVETLPLTAGGKILKRTLVEQAKAGEIVAEPVRYRAPNTAA